jgi:hypothetical protein
LLPPLPLPLFFPPLLDELGKLAIEAASWRAEWNARERALCPLHAERHENRRLTPRMRIGEGEPVISHSTPGSGPYEHANPN